MVSREGASFFLFPQGWKVMTYELHVAHKCQQPIKASASTMPGNGQAAFPGFPEKCPGIKTKKCVAFKIQQEYTRTQLLNFS